MKDDEIHPDSSEPKEEASIGKIGWIGWGGFIVIFLLWAMHLKWGATYFNDTQFDKFNALFSGLAFWGLIFAILLQRHELGLQRRELKLTRREVRGQKEQLEAQNTTLKQQRFENTFFSLLDLFTRLVNSMECSIPDVGRGLGAMQTFKGRECFTLFYNELQRSYVAGQMKNSDKGLSDQCIDAYAVFASFRQTYVGHYFRTLYNIIKFIAASGVPNNQIYINLVRAQLSSSELNLLFYNCLSDYGNKKFKPFVEDFGLLENMELENLINQGHKTLYKESAFKSQF